MFSTPRRRHIGWTLLAVCVAAFLLAVVAVIASTRQTLDQVRSTQIEGTPTGQKLLKASDRILDCTDPNGQCYRDSQARTAQAVGDINRVIVLAAACSVGLDPDVSVKARQIAIQGCVIQRLAVEQRKP